MSTLATVIARGTNAARPAAGNPGRLYFDTTNNQMTRDNGTTWDVVEGTGGMTNPMTTAGDIITGGTAGAAQRLAVGSASQVLTVVSGAPAWATPAAGGGLTQAYVGYNTVGASWEAMTVSRQYLKQITTSAASVISSVDFYLKGNATNVWALQVGLMSDNAGAAGNMISIVSATQSANTALFLNATGRWFSIPVGAYLAAGSYWITILSSSAAVSLAYDTSGSDKYMAAGGFWLSDGDRYTQTATTNQYSMRANTIR